VDLVEAMSFTTQDLVFGTYIETIGFVEYDKLFFNENQKYLMRLILIIYQQHYDVERQSENNYNKLCSKYILILSKRSFKLNLFEELFQALF
jgi:hypothetical protein